EEGVQAQVPQPDQREHSAREVGAPQEADRGQERGRDERRQPYGDQPQGLEQTFEQRQLAPGHAQRAEDGAGRGAEPEARPERESSAEPGLRDRTEADERDARRSGDDERAHGAKER